MYHKTHMHTDNPTHTYINTKPYFKVYQYYSGKEVQSGNYLPKFRQFSKEILSNRMFTFVSIVVKTKYKVQHIFIFSGAIL